MIKRVLITGANSGLGQECGRQLAMLADTEKIYLGCRNEAKAKVAKRALEEATGKFIFEIALIDLSNLESVRSAVPSLSEPIEALVMNAGGTGGKNYLDKTADGVTQIFAVNVLGHAVLLDELLKASKLTRVALYAGSEAARGVPKIGLKRPKLKTSSVDEFRSIIDGTFFADKNDPLFVYGYVKYMAALWMSAMARQYPYLRFVTVSPGSTSGTNVANNLNPLMKLLFNVLGPVVLPFLGLMHNLEFGAKRYVDVIKDESYESGAFYASLPPILMGPLVDQATFFEDLANTTHQDNAHEAIHKLIN